MPGSKAERQTTRKLIAQAQQRQQERPQPPTLPLERGERLTAPPTPSPTLPSPQHPIHGLTREQWVLMQLTLTCLGGGSSPEYAVRDTQNHMGQLKHIALEILGFTGGRA